MSKWRESPSGGDTRPAAENVIQDAVKKPNSGLDPDCGGFTRFVHKFNNNDEMRSPTTTSRDCRPMAQKIKIPKGIAGKIG